MTVTHNPPPSDSILAICLFASFSDGEKSDPERTHIRQLASALDNPKLAELSRDILLGKLSLAQATSNLKTPQDRIAAYEMARAVCEVDDTITPLEQTFLNELKTHLNLPTSSTTPIDEQVDTLALSPPSASPPPLPPSENKPMILKYAILNGALELLPQNLATIAILPLQMKMVYRIGKSHGAELNRQSIVEFLTTAGIGMGSQMVEGFARKIMKNLTSKAIGKTAGKIASTATGSAFSFASTYAIGHLAEKYYSEGRTLLPQDRKPLLATLTQEGKTLHQTYLPEIQNRAKTLTPTAILSLVQGKQQP